MKPILLLALALIPACLVAQTNTSSKAKALVAKMTLEEKVHLLVGMGMRMPGMPSGNGPAVGVTEDKVPGAAGTTFSIPRLNIPTAVVADGPAGVRISPFRNRDSSRSYYATAFPVATLLASTWDTALVAEVGKAIGNETREYGIDILLAPAMNIQRNALGGRNFEYYSEDPVLSGNIGAAMINGIQSMGVGTSLKHFAANNQETNRNQVNAIISERALREIYLRGFEIAVKKSQPWTIMSSYNQVNGTYTSQSKDLLTTILRDEWGFKGFVMTDWFGGKNAVEQMKAGNDLLMPGTPNQYQQIIDAVKNKQLDEGVVSKNAERILTVLLGSPNFTGYSFSNQPDLKAHAKVAHAAAAEGMVLLKNYNGTLPLPASVGKAAAFGNTSYDFIAGGTGSGDVNEAYTVSLVDGLKNAGISIDAELKQQYDSYISLEKSKQPKKRFFFELSPALPELVVTPELAEAKAKIAEVAFITLGRNAGEFQDRKREIDFYLTDAERNLIKTVSAAFHNAGKKVIVIINTGGIIDVASWRDDVDAILLAWQGGQEGGNAVADILTGKVNPSGKLTATFPIKYEDDITARNFPGRNLSAEPIVGPGGMQMGFESEVVYAEGVYVGYRYFNSFNVTPAYEFGFGLSYTDFTYRNLSVKYTAANGLVSVKADVVNTGKRAGKEVVQLYLSCPDAGIDKPVNELKAFGKTRLLQPGEAQTMHFTLQAKDLASFITSQSAWVAPAGNYKVSVGASSINIKATASFKMANTLLVEKVNRALVPQGPANDLKR